MPDLGGDTPGAGTPRALAQVTRLHSIRTLVIARDLGFRKRAMTILAELGPVSFAITDIDQRHDVLALIEQERPDVVVLDATGCAPSILGVVNDLCERAARIGVVVVSSNAAGERLGLPALAKWGWAADLSRAVQQARRDGNPLQEETPFHVQ